MSFSEWVRGYASPWAGIEGNIIPNCVASESLIFLKYLSSAMSPFWESKCEGSSTALLILDLQTQ